MIFFLTALLYARRNFRLSYMTSSIWDFVVLINGFGFFWGLSILIGFEHIAELFYIGILIFIVSLGLLSSQENLKPI